MKVLVAGGYSETELARNFKELIDGQKKQGYELHSWQMTHERYSDGESSYVIVAVFEQGVTAEAES